MTDKNIDSLISKYLARQANKEEIFEIESWAQLSQENTKIFEAFRAIKNSKVREEKFLFADRTFEKIQSRIEPENARTTIRRYADYRFLFMKVAVGLLLTVVASWLVYHFIYTTTSTEAYHRKIEIKSNPAGQRSMIYLPDGSTLSLNAESSIAYETNFSDSVRLVQLTGEAFFMVKKDTTKPFIVQAGNTQITALGTAFNVNAYEDDDKVKVSLENGLVNVQMQNRIEQSGVLLQPGEMATVPAIGNQILVSNFDPSISLAWRDGVIHFNDAPFNEVIQKLERWYGVKFHYDRRPSKEWHFKTTVRNDYLENVLEALRSAERIEYKINGKDVQLKF